MQLRTTLRPHAASSQARNDLFRYPALAMRKGRKRHRTTATNKMYSLATIQAINNRTFVRRDNFNRDSSACFSRGGAVIHSGIHRSTLFIHAERHAESFACLKAWKGNQKALNGFIVALTETGNLTKANATAFRALFPRWQWQEGGSSGNPTQCAYRFRAIKPGTLPVSVAALTIPELVTKVRKLERGNK